MDDEEFLKLLATMKIPEYRKTTINKNGIAWLFKYLPAKNKNTPGFSTCFAEVTRRFKNNIYKS